MKPVDELIPRIAARALSAPEPVIYDAIIHAAQRFCERTRIWREEDSFQTGDSGFEYACAPYGAIIHEIESAYFDGVKLKETSISWLDDQIPTWRDRNLSNPRYITQTEPNTVRLVPAGIGTVKLNLILKPGNDAEELPDFLIDNYRRAIIDGALGEVLSIPKQEFSDPQLAIYYMQRFESKLDQLATQGIQGQQRAPVRSKPSFF